MYVNKSLNQQVLYLGLTFFLSSTIKLTFYNTFIYPYIVYCNSAGRPHTYLTEIEFIICKSELSGLSPTQTIEPIPLLYSPNQEFQILSKPIRLKSPNSCFIIKVTYCPYCFSVRLFVTNSQIHNYDTRTATNYRTHLCRTNLKQFTNSNLPSFQTKMQEFLFLNNQ